MIIALKDLLVPPPVESPIIEELSPINAPTVLTPLILRTSPAISSDNA